MSADQQLKINEEPSTASSNSATKKYKRVWVDGCFDMMHYGHANALRQVNSKIIINTYICFLGKGTL